MYRSERRRTVSGPAASGFASWRGQRINLPLTAQRILAALHLNIVDKWCPMTTRFRW